MLVMIYGKLLVLAQCQGAGPDLANGPLNEIGQIPERKTIPGSQSWTSDWLK